jgi:hypothetical protein
MGDQAVVEVVVVSTAVLSGRLRELEQAGLVAKRTLPPPAASTVYELTDAAAGLAAVLAAMAQWGRALLDRPRPDDEVHGAWLVLGLAVTATESNLPDDSSYELRIDGESGPETFHIRSHGGHLQPAYGPAPNPDAVVAMDAATLVALANGDLNVHGMEAGRRVVVEGDQDRARQLVEVLASQARNPTG